MNVGSKIDVSKDVRFAEWYIITSEKREEVIFKSVFVQISPVVLKD